MTRTEHLLTIIAEEAAEVAQRATKALRFGLEEVQPGQPHTNTERLEHECIDLIAVLWLLAHETGFRLHGPNQLVAEMGRIRDKWVKVEEFLRYSAECGTLAAEVPR